MRILITGGMGFIGHSIAADLEQQGHDVCIVDNLTNYGGIISADELKAFHRARILRMSTTQVYKADIMAGSVIDAIFKEARPDLVIHCAAYPRARLVDSDPVTAINVLSTGLVNLLEACKNNSVGRFVYISSSMVYGDLDDVVTETAPCNPKTTYGMYKYAGEVLTKNYCQRAGIESVVLRPSAVYGPMDINDRVVGKFIYSAIKDRELVVNGADQLLDFTYINDAVNGIILASLSEKSAGNTYNITRGHTRTLLEAAELAVKLAGKGTIKVVDADPAYSNRVGFSNERALSDFGYSGTIDIEQGFADYYDWMSKSDI